MKVLVFGEILYDVYVHKSVIGGAPYNFSVQIVRLIGGGVKIISAVGDDVWGREVLAFTQKEQIDTSLIQVLPDFPTGKASVLLTKDKIPDYIIREGVAWDNIAYSSQIQEALKEDYDVFYFNLLAQRFWHSFATFCEIMQHLKARYKVFDVTLRKYYYTKEKLEQALHFANILKMNEEECALIWKLFYADVVYKYEVILQKIQQDFNIDKIFLTLGEQGAYLLSGGELLFEPVKSVKMVDTLGAGDAFCAALSYGIVKERLSNQQILEFASSVAGEVVQLQGGTPLYDVVSIKNKFHL